ncbi:hypothetical protein [Paenibacillus hamazuiensis]|uniref:hypothetical protein n=1 Tax=Paenibacillus hamazuiensis TaxID=2936508 RepID=UPI00200E1693|nr:hypothetical protein [Paenibacillus hamazuiensis]
MEVDLKQKVLLAFYMEYQKDLSNLLKINHEYIGVSRDLFITALGKLENEELMIFELRYPMNDSQILSYVSITRRGIEYIEKKFEIDSTLSGSEKIMIIENTRVNLNESR